MHEQKHTVELTDISPQQVYVKLAAGGLLIVSGTELAAQWRQRFVEDKVGESGENADAGVCETPQVFTWQGWLQDMLISGHLPLPLSEVQERLLWERVIARDMHDGGGKGAATAHNQGALSGLATQAASAYRLICEYRIPVGELKESHSEESEALARWIEAMRCYLQTPGLKGRILSADLGESVLHDCQNSRLPSCMMLDGFETYSPLQVAILQAMQQAGSKLFRVINDTVCAQAQLIACADDYAQHLHIAARVKSLLDENAGMRIGIVVCDQAAITGLRRALDEALMPEAVSADGGLQGVGMQAVNTPGMALIEFPLLRQLLHVLALAGEQIVSFADFSQLLCSPYLRGALEERDARAQLDADLREHNRHRLSFVGLLQSLQAKTDRGQAQAMPQLVLLLRALSDWRDARKPAGDWVRDVHGLLQRVGFVQWTDAQQRPNGHEIRQMNAFRDVLTSLAAAEVFGERLSWRRFLRLLRSTCARQTLMLAAYFPNVSVLPLEKTAGLRFDYFLLHGLDEEAMPQAPRPQPLLFAALQKKYRLPMSHAALAFATSQWRWNGLLQAAPLVEVCFAGQRDERQAGVSPFVADLTPQSPLAGGFLPMPAVQEAFDDSECVAMQVAEEIRGGVGILRDESACPFRAFATYRLAIHALGETTPGIEPRIKGSLLHTALEFIWQRISSQQELLALSQSACDALLAQAVEHAWAESRTAMDTQIKRVECKRMQRVLGEWLDIEKARPPFRVLATEKKYELQLPFAGESAGEVESKIEKTAGRQGISIHIKADRIDIDDSGQRIMLDYKTGAAQSAAKWLGERMEEPQLPVYALAEADVQAVAFARVRNGEMGFDGLSAEDVGVQGIEAYVGKREDMPADWSALMAAWHASVNALAEEFVAGRADVSPRDAKACNHCTFMGFCRIGEIGMAVHDDKGTG
ncbi:MAG: PD-(D/E)XK nuclease family protein [Mariprofundaceae bacterium]|nr:PD-(D/E)XK nuclease family protein [Mariprofundaceae bacterium]